MEENAEQEETPKQRRINLANDVIVQLKKGRLLPKKGSYGVIHFKQTAPRQLEDVANSDLQDLQEALKDPNIERCDACALGGLLIAKAARYDQVKELKLGQIASFLPDFTVKQLALIEVAFEGRMIGITDSGRYYQLQWLGNAAPQDFEFKGTEPNIEDITKDEFNRALKFNGDWPSLVGSVEYLAASRTRLQRIMENIIQNDGEFIP